MYLCWNCVLITARIRRKVETRIDLCFYGCVCKCERGGIKTLVIPEQEINVVWKMLKMNIGKLSRLIFFYKAHSQWHPILLEHRRTQLISKGLYKICYPQGTGNCVLLSPSCKFILPMSCSVPIQMSMLCLQWVAKCQAVCAMESRKYSGRSTVAL
jgi:hypothetical protein